MLNTKEAAPVFWLNDISESIVEVKSHGQDWLYIKFQDGPIADVGPNGMCMLDILQAMIDRMNQFEAKWPREENRMSVLKMKEAQLWLKEKRENRIKERNA